MPDLSGINIWMQSIKVNHVKEIKSKIYEYTYEYVYILCVMLWEALMQ